MTTQRGIVRGVETEVFVQAKVRRLVGAYATNQDAKRASATNAANPVPLGCTKFGQT